MQVFAHILWRPLCQENQLFLSVGSTWEIAIKVSVGKLLLPEPVDIYIAGRMRLLGAKHLDILYSHACRISSLPLIHRDPFDRLLIAQLDFIHFKQSNRLEQTTCPGAALALLPCRL